MVDPMPPDPETDWMHIMKIADLEVPVLPGDPGRWWLQHLVGTAQEFRHHTELDSHWAAREIAMAASEPTNWLAIFASLNPPLAEDHAYDLEQICKSALFEIAMRVAQEVIDGE